MAQQVPEAASHSLTVLSKLPDATVRLSGLQAQYETNIICPSSVAVQLNGAVADHSFSVWSELPDTMVRPSGLQAHAYTAFV